VSRVAICNLLIFYGEELLASRPTIQLKDHPPSAVRGRSLNVFATTLRILRKLDPATTLPSINNTHTSQPESFFLHLPRKMEPIEGSETSAFKPQTPGKYPKENILHKEHGESLKSRNLRTSFNILGITSFIIFSFPHAIYRWPGRLIPFCTGTTIFLLFSALSATSLLRIILVFTTTI